MENKVTKEIFSPINENIKKLESLFPEIVKDGQVDFEALKQELGQFEEVGKEKYELTWPGKTQAKQLANTDIVGKTLKYVPEDSKNPETTENLYIEGDNLEVLKLLRNSYYGKVKMIYIDPPYNTGNDFVYKDNFAMEVTENEKIEGNIDEEGNRLIKNQEGSGRFHSNWLNMMYPRLKIAKDLLKEDGLIFVQIDDNEVHNLIQLMNEVFDEENYVSTVCVKMSHLSGMKMSHKDKKIPKIKEFIVIYSKNKENITLNPVYVPGKWNDVFDRYTKFVNKNNENCEKWEVTNLSQVLKQNNLKTEDEIEKFCIDNAGNIFRTAVNDSIVGYKKDNTFYKIKTKTGLEKYIYNCEEVLFASNKLQEFDGRLLPAETVGDIWSDIGINNLHNEGGVNFPNGKKPVKLIKRLIQLISGKEDIILDFFSGSSTTAHAVLELNISDGGNRKFIMVQYPENLDENLLIVDSKTKKEIAKLINFLDSINKPHLITEIGKERIKRAGDKIKEDFKNKEGIENLDIGFKVFKVADTNIRWNSEVLKEGQITMEESALNNKDLIDFNPGFTDIDVVYEIMLRHRDFPLTSKIEKLSDIGERTYIFADAVVVCLEEKVTDKIVDGIAAIEPKPIKVIFRDSAFEDDISLKLNTMNRLDAQLKKHNQGKEQSYRVEFI